MLFISDYDLKYDNELLEDTMKYCQHEDIVTADLIIDKERIHVKRMQHMKKHIIIRVQSASDRDILFDLISSNKFQYTLNNFG